MKIIWCALNTHWLPYFQRTYVFITNSQLTSMVPLSTRRNLMSIRNLQKFLNISCFDFFCMQVHVRNERRRGGGSIVSLQYASDFRSRRPAWYTLWFARTGVRRKSSSRPVIPPGREWNTPSILRIFSICGFYKNFYSKKITLSFDFPLLFTNRF